jgi:hypothetical protein
MMKRGARGCTLQTPHDWNRICVSKMELLFWPQDTADGTSSFCFRLSAKQQNHPANNIEILD